MTKAIQVPTEAGRHLDPDILAAFAELALPDSEVDRLFSHLEECERCRDGLRLHTQLRNLDGAGRPALSRFSIWPVTLSFGAAAASVCAVLAVAMLVFWSHGTQKSLAIRSQKADISPGKPPSSQRIFLPIDGLSFPKWKSYSGTAFPSSGEVSATPGAASEVRLSLRKTRQQRASRADKLSGKSYSLHSIAKQKPIDQAAWQLVDKPPALENPWRAVGFRTFISRFAFRSEPDKASLPAPFAAARIEHQIYFRLTSLNEERLESRVASDHPIALRTALGERRFYWGSFADRFVLAH